MRRYAQYYKYDGVGNMLQMKHTTTGGTGNWTRNFDVATTSNKLLQSSIGSNGTGTESYTYDARGNMIDGMNHLLSMEYNDENRLEKVEITASITAYYQYDDDGQRVRKVIVNTSAATRQVRKYINDWEVYQKIDSGTNTIILERETLHIDDQDKRIALIDTPTIDTLSTGEVQLLRYQYCNNISTASLELDENAAVITYEEYYPYGNTSYQGGRSAAECSLKRYRYTGKERDEETGLNYHGARYYAPWLARWVAAEPINNEWYNNVVGMPDRNKKRLFSDLTFSTCAYCNNNPARFIDPTGEFFIIDDLVVGFFRGLFAKKDNFQDGATNRFQNALKLAGKQASNSAKIWGGLFATDPHKNFFGKVFELFSRFTYQIVQTIVGLSTQLSLNTIGLVNDVDYYHGATVATTKGNYGAFTIGSFITGDSKNLPELLHHEYGHYLQSKILGPLYIPLIVPASLISAKVNDYEGHMRFITERTATNLSDRHHNREQRKEKRKNKRKNK